MNFRFTKVKVIVSVIAIVFWYILVFFYTNSVFCTPCSQQPTNCEDVFTFNLIPPGCTGCTCPVATPILEILKDLGIILAPGILIYIIWSFFQKSEAKTKKK